MVAWHRNVNNHEGHIPPQPLWLAIVRAVQGVFNIIVLGLAANAASFFYLEGYGMAFFTFVWTALFLLYVYLTPHYFPHLYHHWGHLGWEATLVIFWLTTFALLADYTRKWDSVSFLGYRYSDADTGGPVDSTRAATAFAVLTWLLFCFTFAISIWLYRGHTGNPISADAGHSHGNGGGFKLTNPFSKKARATDAEKGIGYSGPVNETGQPIAMHHQPEAPPQAYQQPPH